MGSLRSRLLLAASLSLSAFLAVCVLSLNNAFERSALQGQQEHMQGLAYALLGSAEPSPAGQLTVSSTRLPDERLERPQSGLEAALFGDDAVLLWGSPSLRDDVPTPPPQTTGQWHFEQLEDRFVLLFGLHYSDEKTARKRYTLMLIEDSKAYRAQLDTYHRTLWTWLGAAALVLLAVQVIVLRWGLNPLRRLVGELEKIEDGDRTSIEGDYPDELLPLTEGLNAMIVSERHQQARYRNALGDLAHSLKTPLAVLRGIAERPPSEEGQRLLDEQLNRMSLIVDHQLKRAATLGRRTLSEPVPLLPLAEKITGALTKVYYDRNIKFELDVPPSLKMRADPGDLYEMIGNLLDNAAKYGGQKVRMAAVRNRDTVTLHIDDDGNGFPDETGFLLERGTRADTLQEGQGLGLAVVKDVVMAYGGSVTLGKAPTGGGRVTVTLAV